MDRGAQAARVLRLETPSAACLNEALKLTGWEAKGDSVRGTHYLTIGSFSGLFAT